MTIDQISVFVENKAGKLAEIVGILGDNNIDLRAMSIADTTDFGILRLIADYPNQAVEVLKSAEYIVTVTPVLAVAIEDKPGSLAKVLKILSDGGVDIEYLYAFITRKKDSAYVILRVEDSARAVKILSDNNINIATAEDIYYI